MKEALFTNWNFFRFIRLAIGIAILVQAFIEKDVLFGFAGVVFSTMALFNASCCGAGSCATPVQKKTDLSKEISYEEVV